MLFMYMGDQALFVGTVLKMGVLYIKMGAHEAKRIKVRRVLNCKVPDRRLCIDGESYYVH